MSDPVLPFLHSSSVWYASAPRQLCRPFLVDIELFVENASSKQFRWWSAKECSLWDVWSVGQKSFGSSRPLTVVSIQDTFETVGVMQTIIHFIYRQQIVRSLQSLKYSENRELFLSDITLNSVTTPTARVQCPVRAKWVIIYWLVGNRMVIL